MPRREEIAKIQNEKLFVRTTDPHRKLQERDDCSIKIDQPQASDKDLLLFRWSLHFVINETLNYISTAFTSWLPSSHVGCFLLLTASHCGTFHEHTCTVECVVLSILETISTGDCWKNKITETVNPNIQGVSFSQSILPFCRVFP